jgi:hypothetical protein
VLILPIVKSSTQETQTEKMLNQQSLLSRIYQKLKKSPIKRITTQDNRGIKACKFSRETAATISTKNRAQDLSFKV